MSEEQTHFTVHYNSAGEPIDVTSDTEGVTITKGEIIKGEITKDECDKLQQLPRNLVTVDVANTTIIGGRHNPGCRYIWVPRRGWVWVCW